MARRMWSVCRFALYLSYWKAIFKNPLHEQKILHLQASWSANQTFWVFLLFAMATEAAGNVTHLKLYFPCRSKNNITQLKFN